MQPDKIRTKHNLTHATLERNHVPRRPRLQEEAFKTLLHHHHPLSQALLLPSLQSTLPWHDVPVSRRDHISTQFKEKLFVW